MASGGGDAHYEGDTGALLLTRALSLEVVALEHHEKSPLCGAIQKMNAHSSFQKMSRALLLASICCYKLWYKIGKAAN